MDDATHKPINRVVLACIQCRGRHVRCDANQPSCNRCQKDGKECIYQKSKRGGLDKAALARRRERLRQQTTETAQQDGNLTQNLYPDSSNSGSVGGAHLGVMTSVSSTLETISLSDDNLTSSQVAFQTNFERLLEIYYENYWHSCPAVLPKKHLDLRRLTKNHGMERLLLVLHYVGSIFAPWTQPECHYETARRALDPSTLPRTPWNVLALMILSTAQLHTNCVRDARRTLDMATSIAIEIHMNTKEFAVAYGEDDPVLEESWRRTYYFLVLTDQHFSVIVNNPVYALMNVPSFVDLPCDDEDYESGVSGLYMFLDVELIILGYTYSCNVAAVRYERV